jgi:transposase-like protein
MVTLRPTPCKMAIRVESVYARKHGIALQKMGKQNGIPSMQELHKIFFDDSKCIEYLMSKKVLYTEQICIKCRSHMSRRVDKPRLWRCNYSGCRSQVSIFKDTIFSSSSVPCQTLVYLGYMWLKKASNEDMADSTGLSRPTIRIKCNIFAQAVSETLDEEDDVIGGVDVITEIDECLTAKPKHNRGHPTHGCWVLGGVERTQERKVFMVRVPDRKAESLIPILDAHIRPGSIVYSDLWKAYDCLTERTGLRHKTVNHSLFFKDPETGIHTNTIEATWSAFKRNIRPRRRSPGIIDEEIEVFIWRRKHAKDLWNAFLEALATTMFMQ